MICLKGNAARPINKQKKDELKNFLTNLRLKKNYQKVLPRGLKG